MTLPLTNCHNYPCLFFQLLIKSTIRNAQIYINEAFMRHVGRPVDCPNLVLSLSATEHNR